MLRSVEGSYTPSVTLALQAQRGLLGTCGGDLWPPRRAPGRCRGRTVNHDSRSTSLPNFDLTREFVVKESPFASFYFDKEVPSLLLRNNAKISSKAGLQTIPNIANSIAAYSIEKPSGAYGPSLRERITAVDGLAESIQEDALLRLDRTAEFISIAKAPQNKSMEKKRGKDPEIEVTYPWQKLMVFTPTESENSDPCEDVPSARVRSANSCKSKSSKCRHERWQGQTVDTSPALRETWTHGFRSMTRHTTMAFPRQAFAQRQLSVAQRSSTSTKRYNAVKPDEHQCEKQGQVRGSKP